MIFRVEEDASLQRLFFILHFKFVWAALKGNVMSTLEERKSEAIVVAAGAKSEQKYAEEAENVCFIGAQGIDSVAHSKYEADKES